MRQQGYEVTVNQKTNTNASDNQRGPTSSVPHALIGRITASGERNATFRLLRLPSDSTITNFLSSRKLQ